MKEYVVMIAFSFIIIAESLQWASPWTQESKSPLWIMQSCQILHCKPGVGQNVALHALPTARIFSCWFLPALFIQLHCFPRLFRRTVCPGIGLEVGLQSLVGHSLIDWCAVWHVHWPKHSRVGCGGDGRRCWRFWAHRVTLSAQSMLKTAFSNYVTSPKHRSPACLGGVFCFRGRPSRKRTRRTTKWSSVQALLNVSRIDFPGDLLLPGWLVVWRKQTGANFWVLVTRSPA